MRAHIRWARSLLQALRSGHWRISVVRAPLKGRDFHAIRACLSALPQRDQHQLAGWRPDGAPMFAAAPTTSSFEMQDALQDIAVARGLTPHAQALLLQWVGHDRFGRRHWLVPDAAQAWRRLCWAALQEDIVLELVSTFRSVPDQQRIIARKLRLGQDLLSICAVNAPPGFSEHHSGCAVDLAAPGAPVLTEDFERTATFAWLNQHAARFGFTLSYPRNNAQGYIYEPWHWCWARPKTAAPNGRALSSRWR